MSHSYEALDKTKKQIQMIALLPGPRSSIIHCTMRIVDLEAKPEYEALSYEWGSPDSMGEIMLEEQPFPVRRNLVLALSHLRSAKTSKTFWIDAICIDQTNIPERNSQVVMMGDIYRNAKIVRAWLGLQSDASAEVMKLLRRFKKAHSGGVNSKRAHKLADYEKEVLFEFTNLTYWTRIWIVQELVLAQEIVFHCGEEDVVWWPLLLTSLRLAGFLHSPAGLILSLRDRKRNNSLLTLIRNCYSTQATDVRDKVYALLGIADDVSLDTIAVDYTIAVDELKRQVENLYRSQELLNASSLWRLLGTHTGTDDATNLDLGFSIYLDTYFHHPEVFGQIEELRMLGTSTSYSTSAVKQKQRLVLSKLENIEKFNARSVDPGIAMDKETS